MKKDINCILCKYKNNEKKCYNAIHRRDWRCPTLSNIYYGKIVKYFPFNFVQKVIDKVQDIKTENYYDDFNEECTENSDVRFIWGVKSYDDLSHSDANLLTMNDIELVYDKRKGLYFLSMETAYCFNNLEAQQQYLNHLLSLFTRFMCDNNYDICAKPMFHTIFTKNKTLNNGFKTIEDAYSMFEFLVNGFNNTVQHNIKERS